MRTSPEVLRMLAATEPSRVAVIVDGVGSITVAEVERKSNALARGLVKRGVHRGDRVGLYFRSAKWIDSTVAYFGVQKAGGVVVAVPLGSPSAITSHIIRHSECLGVICASDLIPPAFTGWTATVDELTRGQEQEAFWIPVRPEDPADIICTSGTTGMPKGIVRVHDTVTERSRRVDSRGFYGSTSKRVILTETLQGASLTRVWEPFRLFGPTAVTMPSFDPVRFCALVQEVEPCGISFVPAFALEVLNSEAYAQNELTGVRYIRFEGDRLPPSVLRRFREILPETPFVNIYASNESSPARTSMDHNPGYDTSDYYTSVGLGEDTDVRIVDDTGRAIRPGEVGEILLRHHDALQKWYLNDEEATHDVFLRDGWTRTGDIGYTDKDGYLFLLDRRHEIISRGMLAVSTIEVESVLYEHEAVVEVAVFAVPHDDLGEEVAAAVVLRSPTSTQELQRFANERLEPYKVPRHILFTDVLPRNTRGKVIKHLLRSKLAKGRP